MRGNPLRLALTWRACIAVGASLPVLLAASSGPKVKLRPLRKITQLQMGQCEVRVGFILSVSGPPSDAFYCPRVVWEWEDGSFSSEQADCPPLEEASPADHRRTWTQWRAYQKAGHYRVRAHLCKSERRVATVEATALVGGWEGYRDQDRQDAGCSPAHLRPTPPIPTPTGTTTRADEGMLLGVPNDDPMRQVTRPNQPREPCTLPAIE